MAARFARSARALVRVAVPSCALLSAGCAMLLRTEVSRPVAADRPLRPALVVHAGSTVPFFPFGGAQCGVRLDDPRARETVVVANERDRIVAIGPWLLVPLPIVPVWWARQDHKIEDACDPPIGGRDSLTTVLVEIRGRGAWADSLIRFPPRAMHVRRADGSELPLVSAVVRGLGRPSPGDCMDGETGCHRWAQVRVRFAGLLPVEEAFTVEIPDASLGSAAIRFPRLDCAKARGWVVTMPALN